MKDISASVIKKDHLPKMDGSARYVADWPTTDMLFGKIVRSPHPRAKILGIKPPSLPSGYFIVDKRDVPGTNEVHIVLDDTPAFAGNTVEYIGDPVLMLVGPDEQKVNHLAQTVEVEYEILTPVLDMKDSDTAFFDYAYARGDMDAAFADADHVFTEEFVTGHQEQAYLETQGMIAEFKDGKMIVHGSMQCPYYVHTALAKVLGLPNDKVQVLQDYTGGGFGGKEDYPSVLACQVAVAAYKAGGKPVRVIFNRREDIEFTPKRHPSRSRYKAAVKDGKVTAMDIDVLYDAGGYTTLSAVVLQRGVIGAPGIYNVENLNVRGRAMKTNTLPNGAFRGFGGPQTFFSSEMMMDHIAARLGEDVLTFKLRNAARQGDPTSTSGKFHFPVPLPEMVAQVEKSSNYHQKFAEYAKPQTGRYRKGMGVSLWFHGAGFTGSGERDLIKAVARLRKLADGRVQVLTSQTDMGQGIKTTLSKIVAKELSIPLDNVLFVDPDTDIVPDSGPTVASRSLMIVGELLRRAAINLRENWKDGEEQLMEEHFKEPDFVVPFDIKTFTGDAYPTYAWAVAAVEVQVDTLTGANEVLGAWGSFDVGTPIDWNIVVGQMEGGLLQGLAHGSMEQVPVDATGRIRNTSLSDYIIPTAVDVPNLHVDMYVVDYPLGPYGAKGAGELPTVGGSSAYLCALQQALGGVPLNHIPFTTEDTIAVLEATQKEVI